MGLTCSHCKCLLAITVFIILLMKGVQLSSCWMCILLNIEAMLSIDLKVTLDSSDLYNSVIDFKKDSGKIHRSCSSVHKSPGICH